MTVQRDPGLWALSAICFLPKSNWFTSTRDYIPYRLTDADLSPQTDPWLESRWKLEVDSITGIQTPPGSHSTWNLNAKFILCIIPALNEAANLYFSDSPGFTCPTNKFTDKNRFVVTKLGGSFLLIQEKIITEGKKPQTPIQHASIYQTLRGFAGCHLRSLNTNGNRKNSSVTPCHPKCYLSPSISFSRFRE